jgi:hypothetical protein
MKLDLLRAIVSKTKMKPHPGLKRFQLRFSIEHAFCPALTLGLIWMGMPIAYISQYDIE